MGNFKLSENKKILLGYDGKCPDEITIPDGIEIIEKDAFAGKENLKKVKFNSSIKTIKSGAFAKTGIQTVSLPASVSSLSKDSFSYMTMGRQKYGHYECLQMVNTSNADTYVLNSLGNKCGSPAFCGYVETRTSNEWQKYISMISQPSIIIITKQ